jgi:hypothetical protein
MRATSHQFTRTSYYLPIGLGLRRRALLWTDTMAETTTPPHRRRRVLIAEGAMALAVVAAVTAGLLLRASDDSPAPAIAAAPVPTTTTPAPTPTPTPSPTGTPPPVVTIPHDDVAPAVPYRFTLAGKGFTITAHVCAMAPVFPLDPPGEQHHTVCWVTAGFGVKPGSDSRTSYVLGHAWAPDPLEVLNKASARATRDVLHERARQLDGVPIFPAKSLKGSHITLRTPKGVLGYTVRNAFGVDKSKLGEIDSIMDQRVRNRVVVITCAELNGVDYNYNIVLDARLTSSRSTGKS